MKSRRQWSLALSMILLCSLTLSSCHREPCQDTELTNISDRFPDPAFNEYVTNVIKYAFYNKEIATNELTIGNIRKIVTINMANNYAGAKLVSSLQGIENLRGAQILDLRAQSNLTGEYDLRRLPLLYYIRIEGAPNVRLIISAEQKETILGEHGIFDGDQTQLITR